MVRDGQELDVELLLGMDLVRSLLSLVLSRPCLPYYLVLSKQAGRALAEAQS